MGKKIVTILFLLQMSFPPTGNADFCKQVSDCLNWVAGCCSKTAHEESRATIIQLEEHLAEIADQLKIVRNKIQKNSIKAKEGLEASNEEHKEPELKESISRIPIREIREDLEEANRLYARFSAWANSPGVRSQITDRRLRNLISQVMHEMGNYLSPSMSVVEQLESEGDDEGYISGLNFIYYSVIRGIQLNRNVEFWAQMRGGAQEDKADTQYLSEEKRKFTLAQLLTNLEREVSSLIGNTRITFSRLIVDESIPLPSLLIDHPQRLYQVIVNLISNVVDTVNAGDLRINLRAVPRSIDNPENGSFTVLFEVSISPVGILGATNRQSSAPPYWLHVQNLSHFTLWEGFFFDSAGRMINTFNSGPIATRSGLLTGEWVSFFSVTFLPR